LAVISFVRRAERSSRYSNLRVRSSSRVFFSPDVKRALPSRETSLREPLRNPVRG
jgi:hypothetical protein